MSGVDMKHYSEAAVERTMKIQEVILRAVAKKITWWQAAEIIGISDRQMRRWGTDAMRCTAMTAFTTAAGASPARDAFRWRP
jgi:hypothetical protein